MGSNPSDGTMNQRSIYVDELFPGDLIVARHNIYTILQNEISHGRITVTFIRYDRITRKFEISSPWLKQKAEAFRWVFISDIDDIVVVRPS